MVIAKQYLRWERYNVVGGVYSSGTNCIFVNETTVFVPTCEFVNLWNIRTKHVIKTFATDNYVRVTRIAFGNHLAVGYSDGSLRLFDSTSSTCLAVLCGHKSDITALNFNSKNTLLFSGGKDTVIVVWDVINQAGLFKLLGHSGPITNGMFLENSNSLVTSSKDCLIKFWDLNIQHCYQTIVGHKTEVTDFTLLDNEKVLVSGSQDAELRFFQLESISDEKDTTNSQERNWLNVSPLGSVLRTQTSSVVSIKRHLHLQCFYCLSQNSKIIERFELRSEKDLDKVRKKKNKKQSTSTEKTDDEVLDFAEKIKFLTPITFSHTVKCFDVFDKRDVICAGLFNNNLEFTFVSETSKNEIESLSNAGHRSDVRALCVTSDGTLIVTCSKETTKVWNRNTSSCVRTIPSGFALCCCMAPGNRHIITGTKTGKLYIIDIGGSEVAAIIDAHLGEIWAVEQFPNMRGLVSGGSDKCLKFWDYVLEPEHNDKLVLNLSLSKKFDLDEDILCVKISSDSKYVAVALLDNSVKVFFLDSLKFFLNMYGHKLPVVSLDISSDTQLLVSGSADRNMKIWGMDFGDCHRSLFAHEDSITCVRFLPNTHLVFSCGKDGLIKQWDADKFQLIQILRAHFKSTVWTLDVGPNADFIVSSGGDKSIRVWERTMEPLIIEEEKENEREKEFDKEIEENLEREEPNVPEDIESGLPSRKTVETLKGAELLMERLEICEQSSAGESVPILQALCKNSTEYLLEALCKITNNEIEQSLIMLPYSYATKLIELCCKEYILKGLKIETTCKIVLTLIRMHHARIVCNDILSALLLECKSTIQTQLKHFKDRISFNTFVLQYLKQQIEAKDQTRLFADATDNFKEKSRKLRKRDKAKAVLTVVS